MKKLVVGFNDDSEFTAVKRMQRSKIGMWKGYSVLVNGRCSKGVPFFFHQKWHLKELAVGRRGGASPYKTLLNKYTPGLDTLNALKTLPLIRRKLKSGICQSLITSASDCQRFLWKNPPAQTDLSVIATMQPYTDLTQLWQGVNYKNTECI